MPIKIEKSAVLRYSDKIVKISYLDLRRSILRTTLAENLPFIQLMYGCKVVSSVSEDLDSSTPPYEELSDQELLERFQQGDEEAATHVYQRYAHRVHGLIRKKTSTGLSGCVEPEDLVQSVFRSFFRRSATNLYQVPGEADLWNLLLVIALNKVRDAAAYHHRAKRDVRRNVSFEQAELPIDPKLLGDERVFTELILTIEDLLSGLPFPDNRIVELRIQGHDLDAIAENIQRSRRTVERVLQNFRIMLKAQIQ